MPAHDEFTRRAIQLVPVMAFKALYSRSWSRPQTRSGSCDRFDGWLGEVEPGGHVEIEPAIRVDVAPEERREGAPLVRADEIVEPGGLEHRLQEQGVDVDEGGLE